MKVPSNTHEKITEGFTMIPNRLIRYPYMNHKILRVYSFLRSHTPSFPDYGTIQRHCNISRDELLEALHWLHDRRIIEVRQRPDKEPNTDFSNYYYFYSESKWLEVSRY